MGTKFTATSQRFGMHDIGFAWDIDHHFPQAVRMKYVIVLRNTAYNTNSPKPKFGFY
jgi:hypothetical protein